MTKPIVLDEDGSPRRVPEPFRVKWTTMVLHSLHLRGGTCRPGALAQSLPGRSKKMQMRTLPEMERDGLIDREVDPVVPPKVEYPLTPMGELFIELQEMFYAWAVGNDEALSQLTRRRKGQAESNQAAI
jgi:DNA-binding HxlR family transcriptional regulator